ncbi:MAG: pilus assembly protein [Selenomonadaceae bacterium]|nr:pilus assembly protein [Selenomonadaceae bacterium]
MKIFRRGQASIEFALILPIFAMLLFALVYVGFLFIDVVTLDSAAAAAARNAAANNGTLSSDFETKFSKPPQLFLYWYEVTDWPPKHVPFKPEEEVDNDHVIRYGVQAHLKDSVKENKVLKMFLPEKYTVVKSAYKE